MKKYLIILNKKLVDIVRFDEKMTIKDVKKALIEKDGFDLEIVLVEVEK